MHFCCREARYTVPNISLLRKLITSVLSAKANGISSGKIYADIMDARRDCVHFWPCWGNDGNRQRVVAHAAAIIRSERDLDDKLRRLEAVSSAEDENVRLEVVEASASSYITMKWVKSNFVEKWIHERMYGAFAETTRELCIEIRVRAKRARVPAQILRDLTEEVSLTIDSDREGRFDSIRRYIMPPLIGALGMLILTRAKKVGFG